MPRKWPFGNAARAEAVVSVAQQLPPSLERLRAGALALSKPETAGILLKAAATETLLAAYRRRFLAALPGMVNMRRENFRRADPVVARAVNRRFLEASQRYNDAQVRGTAKAVAESRAVLDYAREAVRRALKPQRASKRPLPHGQFRRLALRVLDLVADVHQAEVFVARGQVVLGIGNLAALEMIRTPSATRELTGHDTASTRDVLWRHLEFGTGAFATDPKARLPGHRLAGGGWWYGRSAEQSLELRGSKAGKMMGDPARKLPHQPESARFRAVLFQFMNSILFGS